MKMPIISESLLAPPIRARHKAIAKKIIITWKSKDIQIYHQTQNMVGKCKHSIIMVLGMRSVQRQSLILNREITNL